MFILLINNLDNGKEYTLSKFIDETKWEEGVDTPDGHVVVQWELDRLEKWADRNLLNSTQRNAKYSAWGERNPYNHTQWG